MDVDIELRKQLVNLLEGGQAHMDFSTAVENFPVEKAGSKPNGAPHSGWQLLEHLRITQHDILQFSLGTDYQSLKWPDDYWPKTDGPPDAKAWSESIKAFQADLEALKKLASDPKQDLYKPFDHGEGQNLLREILLAADHNSHHVGQLLFMKKTLAATRTP